MACARDLNEPILSYNIEVLHSAQKTSFYWKHFGKLILTRDGKRKHVYTDKVFCKLCFDKCVEDAAEPTNDADPDDVVLPGEDQLIARYVHFKNLAKDYSSIFFLIQKEFYISNKMLCALNTEPDV